MHEASLCDALLDQVDAALAPHPGALVLGVHVALGELSGVDPELFQLAFDTLGPARHPRAALTLTPVPARWRCPACGVDRATDAPLQCAGCGGPLRLVAGAELTLTRIELGLPPTDPEVNRV